MKRIFFVLLLSSFYSYSLIAQVNYNFPESVVYDVQNNRYLISNTGNGNIIARNQNGSLSYFNQGGSASIRGITISDNKLFAAGDEGILVYNLATGQKTATYAIPDKIFPNDIVSDALGNIYVSDDPAHKIYKWTATTQQVSTFVTMSASDNPNGLFYDQTNNRLITVLGGNNAPIKAVDLSSSAVTTLKSTTLKDLDGITRDKLGNYYISAWGQNAVYKFNGTFTTGPDLVFSGYNGPADIFYDNMNNILAIPNMNVNEVEFRQMSSVTVTKPNGGEIWQVGSSQNIQWTSSNVIDVIIEYSTNFGTSWNTIIAQTNAAAGSYPWTIPNTPSTICLVRVSDFNYPNIKDVSNAAFTIELPPSITVVSPNGGEVWRVGTTQNIQWTSINVNTVKIEYSTNSGTTWSMVAPQSMAIAGSHSWIIPNTPSPYCLVKISDASNEVINDQSNSMFGIELQPAITVIKPNGGEIWNIGSQQNIQWTSTNVAEVKIEYSTNNGINWIEIINKVNAASGTYQWTIPNTPSTNCSVRVSNYSEPNVKDQSDNIFKIQVPVSVENENVVYKFHLAQNYPNPFNPETTIEYSIPASLNPFKGGTLVTLKIYDVLGREIITLVNEEKFPGNYEVKFSAKGGSASGGNGTDLQSGVYLYRLQAGSFTKTKKFILLK